MIWTSRLAYVVGLIATDGSLSKDKRHIILTSKDLEQIQTFAKLLNLKNKIGLKGSSYNKEKKYYFIQFGNVRLYRFLESIGLTPNKTKSISTLLIPDSYFPDFLRGSLDGDGYTYSYWDRRWKNSFLLYLGFISASKAHLEWISSKIQKLYGLKGNINFLGRSTYRLIFAKRASLELIKMLYYQDNLPCLGRKRLKILRSLDIILHNAEVGKLVDPLP